jgi:hypothetical protein
MPKRWGVGRIALVFVLFEVYYKDRQIEQEPHSFCLFPFKRYWDEAWGIDPFEWFSEVSFTILHPFSPSACPNSLPSIHV